ncbi:MAG: tripartite tricarboxylate transporter TctB family protein [Rhodospirillales bacterium]|nr:tripartite tricarboxylate transporter TctB family protein [Rhodospirillales bacterium]
MNDRTRARLMAFVPPIIVLAMSVAFLVISYGYDVRARQVPVLIGWSLIVLCVLDLVATSDTAMGQAVQRFFTGTIVGEAEANAHAYPLGRVLVAAAWPIAFVALVYLFGFMAVIPVYVFLFVAVHGKKGVRQGLWATLVTSAFTYVVFEQFLRYEVYRGIFFEG